MKVVKLDKRHRLFRKGMVYAFKFNNEWEERARVESILRNMYGWEYGNDDWHTFRGKVIINRNDLMNVRTYPYWIGVKNEADITAVMLQL
jgi:hypothetical protein